MSIDVTLSGYVVGPIWWPAGAECFKPFTHSVTDEAPRMGTRQLRDHVLAVMRDGDFQSTSIACGEVTIRSRSVVNGRTVVRAKSVPLYKFPTLADCLHTDPDWAPVYEGDDYDD